MPNSFGRHPRPWIAGVLAAVVLAMVISRPSLAQRPPIAPPGDNPRNPAPGRVNPPAQLAPNQGGNQGKQGIIGSGRPVAPGQPGAQKFETIWRCSNCNEELGRGEVKPNLTTCPKCGVYLDPNYSPGVPANNTSNRSVPPIGLLGFVCIGFLVAVVVIVVLIKWALG